LALFFMIALVPAAALVPLPATAEDRAPATITLDTSATYQTITSWEATAWMGQDSSPNVANYSADVMDLAVDELGLNRLRLEVRAGIENPEDYWTQYQEGVVDYAFWRSHRYTTLNDDADIDTINWSSFHFSELDNTVEKVVLPFMAKVTARGETPLINLNYVAFTSQNGVGTQYIHDDADEYAEMMLATFIHLDGNYSLVPDHVEVILEPDNVAQWDGYTIGNAIVATKAKLATHGYHPQFIAPSNTNMGGAITYFDQMASVTGAVASLAELSYHRYGGVSDANLQAIDQRRSAYGIGASMLEHIGSGHEDLYKDLSIANCTSWQQFALAGFGPSDDGGVYLLIDETDPANPVVTMGSRTKFLRQYFAYVRPGAVRVGATTDDGAFAPLAFTNPDGRNVVVVKADYAGTVSVRDLPAGTYGITYTTATQYDVALPDASVGHGGWLSATIPAAGVITISEIRRAPEVTYNPRDADVNIHEGTSQTFTVTPKGTTYPALAYTWTLDGDLQEGWNETWFEYAADFDSAGSHSLTVTVNDVRDPSLYTTFTWYIDVLDVNRAPTILDYSPEALWMVNETEDGEVLFTVSATDEDYDALTFNWYADSQLQLSGPYSTYTFSYDFFSAGDHVITVSISDGIDTTTVTWTLRILDVDRPPSVLSYDPDGDMTVNETDYGYLRLSVEAWDPDGDRLTYQWYLNDDLLYGQYRSYYTFIYNHESAGTYRVRVAITDGITEIGVGWLITVIDINVPPRIDYVYPSWSPYYYEAENSSLQFSVTATDPEGEEMTYYWEVDDRSVPSDETPSQYTYRWGFEEAGDHLINVTVSDGEDGVSYSWTLHIYDTNRPPVIDAVDPDTHKNISGAKPLRVEVFASDPDEDDNLTYHWYLNGTLVEDAEGPFFILEVEEAYGNYTVQVLVYDDSYSFASHQFNVTVDPTLDDVPPWVFPWWGYIVVGVLFAVAFVGILWWAMERERRKRTQMYG
jgi:hypothetical protein